MIARTLPAALVAALALAASGAPPAPAATHWPAAACLRQSRLLAGVALQSARHYGADSAYPADVAYYSWRYGLAVFRRHGCAQRVLARTLAKRLTRRQLAVFLAHLPPAMAGPLRRALRR